MYFAFPVPFSSSFVSPVAFFLGKHTLLYLDEIGETTWRREGCLFVCLFIFFLMWGIDILGSNAYEQIVSTGFFRNCRVMYDLTNLPNVRHRTPEKPGGREFFFIHLRFIHILVQFYSMRNEIEGQASFKFLLQFLVYMIKKILKFTFLLRPRLFEIFGKRTILEYFNFPRFIPLHHIYIV